MAKKKSKELGNSKEGMAVPQITHLQFLVIDAIASLQQASASEIRKQLSEYGLDQKGPKFYQLMGRLEKAGFIESWSQPFDAAGSEVTRTFYKNRPDGKKQKQLVCEFYAARDSIRDLIDRS